MSKAIYTQRQKALTEAIKAGRIAKGMSQAEVAKALGRHQPFIANIESGERRLDVVEFTVLSQVIGLDAPEVVRDLMKVKSKT